MHPTSSCPCKSRPSLQVRNPKAAGLCLETVSSCGRLSPAAPSGCLSVCVTWLHRILPLASPNVGLPLVLVNPWLLERVSQRSIQPGFIELLCDLEGVDQGPVHGPGPSSPLPAPSCPCRHCCSTPASTLAALPGPLPVTAQGVLQQ